MDEQMLRGMYVLTVTCSSAAATCVMRDSLLAVNVAQLSLYVLHQFCAAYWRVMSQLICVDQVNALNYMSSFRDTDLLSQRHRPWRPGGEVWPLVWSRVQRVLQGRPHIWKHHTGGKVGQRGKPNSTKFWFLNSYWCYHLPYYFVSCRIPC